MISGTIMGRLVADPEVKQLGEREATFFRLASDNPFHQKDDEGNRTSTFITCKLFGRRGEVLAEHAKKGSAVAVVGTLYMREWETNDGQKGKSLEAECYDFQFVGSGAPSGGPAPVEKKAAPVAKKGTPVAKKGEPVTKKTADSEPVENDPFELE